MNSSARFHTSSAPPVSLSALFPSSDDEEEKEEGETGFQETYETTEVRVYDQILRIRQFSFHKANANQIW